MKTTKIFGPPGTGKTTSLIEILTGLLETGYHPSQISYLSFTNAAVEETKQRIARRFTSFDLRKDFKHFRTVHSACCLKAGIAMPEIMSAKDYEEFEEETGYSVKPKRTESYADPASKTWDQVLNAKSYATHKKMPLHEATFRMQIGIPRERIDQFIEEYEAFKKRVGKLDFDDMLLECLGKGSLGTPIILVDECQDLSDLQLDLVKEWSVGCEALYLAGDDDQSIYAFNGASEYGFLEFPADEVRVLRKSHRVPLVIGERAERVIKKVTKRKAKSTEWTLNEGEIRYYSTLNQIGSVPLIEAAKAGRDVMFLTRHRLHGNNVRKFLTSLNIPHTVDGKQPWSQKLKRGVQAYYKLLSWEKINAQEAQNLVTAIGGKIAKAEFRKILSIRKEFTLKDFPDMSWEKLKGSGPLLKLISEHGIDILDKPVTFDVSTFHSSKGREADVVVVLTDCFEKVLDTMQIAPDTERRLCYVALTRAREKLFIIDPEDPTKRLTPLLEA